MNTVKKESCRNSKLISISSGSQRMDKNKIKKKTAHKREVSTKHILKKSARSVLRRGDICDSLLFVIPGRSA